jgi:iron complex outermembrane receptor protein
MKFYYSFVAVFLISSSVYAEEDFTSLLDDMTSIATKTKLNIDYQPSVVSVLHADKLKKIGIRNLYEAIGLLPGIEISILHTGTKQLIIRGNYNPDTFVFDKYKLYIDGIDVGSNLYSTSYYYLDFPIELIDSIEVLRGSASSIYGPGAFSGAINVITKSSKEGENNVVFASLGSYEYAKIGFVQHLKTNEWSIGVDGYFQRNNKKLDAGSNFVSADEASYTRTDYKSLEGFRDYSVGIMAKNSNFTLMARYKSEVTENFYGIKEELEPVLGGYQSNESAIVALQYKQNINSDLSSETKIGLNYYAFSFDTTVYQDHQGSGFTFRIKPTYKELNSYIDINLAGKNIEDNTWMLGVGVQKNNTLKNEYGTTIRTKRDDGPFLFSNSLVYLNGKYGFLNGDHDQWIKSLYFQDIYAFNKNLDFSINLRLDDYSLFGQMLSYRFGGVYRFNDANIFKVIYGRSYRTPAKIEAFQASQDGLKDGNPNLDSEMMDTYELAYTYKKYNTILRTNLFYSVMKNVIDAISNEPASYVGDYANHKSRNAKGAEMEFTYRFDNGSELMANLSYVRTEYFTTDYYTPMKFQSPEISELLSKGYYLYPVMPNLSLNTAWYYNGAKNGLDDGDKNHVKKIKASMIIDETIAYDIDASSDVMLSVKNLFNTALIYPSFAGTHDGIRREGRNWLLTYEKKF